MTENITVFKQNSIRIKAGCGNIYIDPFQLKETPKDAAYIFITHDHYDHFSPEDIEKAAGENTVLVVPEKMENKAKKLTGSISRIISVKPGGAYEADALEFETVPMYNILKPFHPKSALWCGYILKIDGKPVKLKKSEADAIKHKIAYVTEDRKGNGLVLSQSIKVNTSLAHLDAISSHTVIDGDKEYAVAEEYRDKLKIKTPTVEQLVGNLSGGNQQKVLLAKWMFAEPDIMLLDEPTRGIDVGAKYEIYCIINDLAAAGKSVVMISSELPEVLGLCDRIYIMNEGKMVGEMKGSEATQESIMAVILKSGRGE